MAKKWRYQVREVEGELEDDWYWPIFVDDGVIELEVANADNEDVAKAICDACNAAEAQQERPAVRDLTPDDLITKDVRVSFPSTPAP